MDKSLDVEIIPNDNQSSVSHSHLEEKINEIDPSQLYYENALDTFQKKQYKKALKYIETILPELDDRFYWRAVYLKLTCYQEIIELKIQKYYNKSYLTSATKYFSLFNENIKKLFIELKKNPHNPEHLNKCECVITLVLRQCYNYAQFCIHQDLLYDCIGFLSIGERLIRNTAKFFISPDSNYYASSIFLFLSTMFIISDNFGNAKKYIILCLKLSYIELELRLDINHTFSLVDLGNFKEEEQEKINRIFFNLSICFFHLGVVYEHEYEIESAYHAYKQAKWFSHAVPNDELINFVVSLFNMEKRELLRLKLIEFFKKEEKDIQEEKKELKPKPKVWFDEETNLKKYEKLEEYITKMKIIEVDDDDPDLLNKVHGKPFSKQVGIPTKTIHILNYLMDDKFKDVIEKMKKLEINCLSKQTKDIIQKQILNIKNEERIKDEEEKKKKEEKEKKKKEDEEKKKLEDEEKKKTEEEKKVKTEEENKIKKEDNEKNGKDKQLKEEKNLKDEEKKNIIDNKKNDIFKIKKKKLKKYSANKIRLTLFHSPNNSLTSEKFNSLSNDFKNENNIYHSTFNNYKKSNILKKSINCSKKNKTFTKDKKDNEIERIIIDNKIFNKNLKNKKRYLEEQFNRELKFQKNLLKCKGGGIGYYNSYDFDERKIKDECEDFFKKNLENEMKLALEKNIKKDDKAKSPSYERQNINMFRLPSKITYLMNQPKKEIIPSIENRKYIDNLTNEIQGIDTVKKYLLKSYKRSLKKNG